ncbi:hypothetical protein ABPG74_020189 [Tetrahymena malaccensis]
MNSIDSGGCISNQGKTLLQFSNTMFDSCQSGMFGGAIYSLGINVTDQLIIKNSRSKIGGGIFVCNEVCWVGGGLDKINYFNNTATISSQQYFKCTSQPYNSWVGCNLFELDSIYELNQQLMNTPYYQAQKKVKVNFNGTTPQIYFSEIFLFKIIIIRLKVEYRCPEKQFPQLCSVREFSEDQFIGNLYNYIHKDYQSYFYNYEIPNINYPYVLTSYNQAFDCQLDIGWNFIFIINLFQAKNAVINSRKGCFYPTSICEKGMQKWINQQQQAECKYCDIGSCSESIEDDCEICNTDKFDKCYAKDSYLKNYFWRPQNSKFNDIYFCQLNQQSCQGEQRSGYGNDLCSEGYIGAQCLTCDIMDSFGMDSNMGRKGISNVRSAVLSITTILLFTYHYQQFFSYSSSQQQAVLKE